jgi:hypothetical protein
MSQYINKQDYNQVTTSQTKAFFKQFSLLAYDAMKAVLAFIGSMARMVMGK